MFQGTVGRYIDYRIVPDFGEGRAVIQDANLDIRFSPAFTLRFGKFKGPLGLERLQSSADITFVERALPTGLTPNRDVGVQLFGQIAEGTIGYAAAIMNGVPDGASGDIDNNEGKDFLGRIFFLPFQQRSPDHFLRGLGLGISLSSGSQEGLVLPVYRTSAQSIFFSYAVGTAADGRRERFTPQAYFYKGPLGLMAEYVSSAQEMRRADVNDAIRNDAWQVAASWFITGEDKGYRSTPPDVPFDPVNGGAGAFEIAARYAELSVDKSAFEHGFADAARSANRAQEWLAGTNWYLNRHAKLMINFGHTRFAGGGLGADRESENAILSRFQIFF
jgi:phosphate-selective porin OprO/OprP